MNVRSALNMRRSLLGRSDAVGRKEPGTPTPPFARCAPPERKSSPALRKQSQQNHERPRRGEWLTGPKQ